MDISFQTVDKTLLVSTPEAKRREMGNLVHHFQTEDPSVCDIDFDFFYCLAHTSDAVQIKLQSIAWSIRRSRLCHHRKHRLYFDTFIIPKK